MKGKTGAFWTEPWLRMNQTKLCDTLTMRRIRTFQTMRTKETSLCGIVTQLQVVAWDQRVKQGQGHVASEALDDKANTLMSYAGS
jgi:hypothetical protein